MFSSARGHQCPWSYRVQADDTRAQRPISWTWLVMVTEGDRLRSARGLETTVYDLATCTETGQTIVIHGCKGRTMTTPLSLLLKRNFVVVDKRGVPVEPTR